MLYVVTKPRILSSYYNFIPAKSSNNGSFKKPEKHSKEEILST